MAGRTSVHPVYVLAVLALAIWCIAAPVPDMIMGRWWHAAFLALNGCLFLYAVSVYMGWRESFSDLGLLSGDQQEVNQLLLADGMRDDGIMLLPSATLADLRVSDDETDFDEVLMAAEALIANDAPTPLVNESLVG